MCGLSMNNKFNFIHLFSFYIFLLVFRLALDYAYIVFVHPIFSYEGYTFDFNYQNYFVSWFLYVTSFIFVKDSIRVPSDYFFITAVLAVFAPLTSFFGLNDIPYRPILYTFLSFLLIWLLLKSDFVKPIYFKISPKANKFAFNVSVISIFVLIFWYVISGAVNYFNLDFSKVYEYRSLSSKVATVGPMAYFNVWVYNVFIVYAMAYTLLHKKYYLTLLFVIIQIFFYGVSAHKTVFFTPFLIVSIWFYFKRFRSVMFMVVTFTFLILSSVFLYFYNNNLLVGSMFIRRVFFVPAKLTYDYFYFFDVNPKVLWSNSILSWIFDYPYPDRVTKMIGYENDSEASANNGYISSGFSHAGLFGVLIYSYIIAFFLKNIDFFIKFNVPLWFILCLIVTPMRSFLISSDLLTGLLTHGFLLAFLLLLLSRNSNKV